MKIAIISPWTISPNAIGGTERFVVDLAESFTILGHSVDVYMLSGKEYNYNKVNYRSINLFDRDDKINEFVLRKRFGSLNNIDAYIKLANKIEKLVDFSKYDLIHLNSLLFLKLCKGKKRIFTIHTNPFEYKMDWGKSSFEIMIKIMKEEGKDKNTVFVAPSQYYSKKYYDLSGVKIKHIPHAININRLKSSFSNKEILEKLDLDGTKKIILLPSRLEPCQKQPMLFFYAFSKFNDSIKKQFQVICTGADDQYIQYKNVIEDFCLNNNILLKVIRFDNMADAYKIASLVVLPSKSESFGYSALEAISLGIPTILNKIPTYEEIFKLSKNTYIFNNSEQALFCVLNKCLNMTLKRIRQSDEWLNQYKMDLFAYRYLQLLNEI